MPDPVRRLSVPPLADLEGQGCRSVGGGGAAGRVPHPFPLSSSAVCGTHPYAFVQPLVHQRGCARGGHPGFNCQGCGGACSTSLSQLLQPSVCGLENLRVVASGHRSLNPQLLRGRVTLPDGDHSVCPAFHPSGQLDGLHRSPGGLPSGSRPSGISSLPLLCDQWPGLSIQGTVFRPLHGPAGFHPCHGSCFCHPPLVGYSHASLPRRLACPVFLSRVSPPGSPGCPGPLSGAGCCDQPREVQPCSLLGCTVSRGDHQCPVFCGFSVARSRLQASVNRRRISVLRLASYQCLALSAGDAFLPSSSRPRRETAHEVPLTLPSSVLGSGEPVVPDSVVSGLPSGSAVVASLAPSVSGCLSPSGVSRPRLLVRCLGRRLWGTSRPSGRFRPLGRVGGSALYQCQRAPCRPSGSPPLPVVSFGQDGCRFLRQRHGGGVSSQGRGHEVSLSQLHSLGDPPLVGVARHPSGSAVHPGLSQRPRGHSVSSSPALSYRVVPQQVFLSLRRLWPVQIVLFATSENRHCLIYFSPFRDPQSAGTDVFLQSWDGLQAYAFPPWSIIPRILAKLRESQGMELTLVAPYWPRGPWFPDLLQLLLAPPVFLPDRPNLLLLPRSRLLYQGLHRLRLHAWRLRRFTRAAGFSSTVASQASLACRPSSNTNYQLKWSVYRFWCRSHGHSVSHPTLSKVADFLCWLRSARGLGVSSIKGYRSMLSAVFRFHLPSLSSHRVLRDLLRSFRLSLAERLLPPPAWDLSVVLRFLNSSAFEPLA